MQTFHPGTDEVRRILTEARVFWMQDGVVDPTSAARVLEAGLQVVMDDCTLRRHRQLGLGSS